MAPSLLVDLAEGVQGRRSASPLGSVTWAYCSDRGGVVRMEFTEEMRSEVDGDAVRREGLQGDELPTERLTNQARTIAPSDASSWIGSLYFAIRRIRPLL